MTSPLKLLAPLLHDCPSSARPRYVGVYFLIRKDEVVYVGQTLDLESRLASHRARRKHPVRRHRRRWDRAAWIPLPPESLDAFEGALIRALRPEYNSKGVLSSTSGDAPALSAMGLLGFARPEEVV